MFDDLQKIETSDLMGGHRRVLKSEVKHAYSISYQSGFLYWSEWRNCDIRSLEVSNPTADSKVLRRNMPSLMGISASTRFEKEPSQ